MGKLVTFQPRIRGWIPSTLVHCVHILARRRHNIPHKSPSNAVQISPSIQCPTRSMYRFRESILQLYVLLRFELHLVPFLTMMQAIARLIDFLKPCNYYRKQQKFLKQVSLKDLNRVISKNLRYIFSNIFAKSQKKNCLQTHREHQVEREEEVLDDLHGSLHLEKFPSFSAAVDKFLLVLRQSSRSQARVGCDGALVPLFCARKGGPLPFTVYEGPFPPE